MFTLHQSHGLHGRAPFTLPGGSLGSLLLGNLRFVASLFGPLCRRSLFASGSFRLPSQALRLAGGIAASPFLFLLRHAKAVPPLLHRIAFLLLRHALPVHLLVGIEPLHQLLPGLLGHDERLRGKRNGDIRHV